MHAYTRERVPARSGSRSVTVTDGIERVDPRRPPAPVRAPPRGGVLDILTWLLNTLCPPHRPTLGPRCCWHSWPSATQRLPSCRGRRRVGGPGRRDEPLWHGVRILPDSPLLVHPLQLLPIRPPSHPGGPTRSLLVLASTGLTKAVENQHCGWHDSHHQRPPSAPAQLQTTG